MPSRKPLILAFFNRDENVLSFTAFKPESATDRTSEAVSADFFAIVMAVSEAVEPTDSATHMAILAAFEEAALLLAVDTLLATAPATPPILFEALRTTSTEGTPPREAFRMLNRW